MYHYDYEINVLESTLKLICYNIRICCKNLNATPVLFRKWFKKYLINVDFYHFERMKQLTLDANAVKSAKTNAPPAEMSRPTRLPSLSPIKSPYKNRNHIL